MPYWHSNQVLYTVQVISHIVKYRDWTMLMSPYSWTGITCNNKSRVVALDLKKKNLAGKISQ
jgi:hypothetical protein